MGVELAKLLTAGLMMLAEYRKGRDAVIAAGDPTDPNTGNLLTDAELIELLKLDGAGLTTKIDNLLAKHGAAPLPSPTDPPAGDSGGQ